jgi:hypothetical protein
MKADQPASEYKEAERHAAHPTVTPTPQARAGVTGHNVRYVLMFSIGAAVLGFLIVYLVYF